jgi:hypothetical protein
VPEVKLNAADAAELAEMLEFLSEWLARDPGHLAASLAQFVGHPAYGLDELRSDLERLSSSSAATMARPCSALTDADVLASQRLRIRRKAAACRHT